MDGSPVFEAPVELEGVDVRTVLTTTRISPGARHETVSASSSCLRSWHLESDDTGESIERVGVTSESVTFLEPSGRGVLACDNSPGPREDVRSWCGRVYAVLFDGRLRDPRLSIGCSTSDGKPMGFAWIQPEPNSKYVVVEQPGYAEVYETAGGLPVRVATATGVEFEGSRASFDLLEHAADGKLARAYRLEAAVAG